MYLLGLALTSFCISVFCAENDSVEFLCHYSKFHISLKRLSDFQLLENLYEDGLEQPIDLSAIQNCSVKNLKLLLNIIPDLPTKNIKKSLLPNDFKANLALALLGNMVGYNKDYLQELIRHLSKKTITRNSYRGVKKLILSHNNGHSSKPVLLQCVNPEYRCLQTLTEHTEAINGLELNPNNHLISSGETTTKVWNPKEQYQCIQTLEGSVPGGHYLIFNPMHKHFISVTQNTTIQIGRMVPSNQELKSLDAVSLLSLITYMQHKKYVTKKHENDFNQLPIELQEDLKKHVL